MPTQGHCQGERVWMGGERGALEGIEPHHRSRENGLECSDHLSIGTDICKYLDYGNVF